MERLSGLTSTLAPRDAAIVAVAMGGPRQGIREGGANPSQSYLTTLLRIRSLLGFGGTECG